VDSHPDMMVPQGPLPGDVHELYSQLEHSMGGIAVGLKVVRKPD
jgi:hypothetical protein